MPTMREMLNDFMAAPFRAAEKTAKDYPTLAKMLDQLGKVSEVPGADIGIIPIGPVSQIARRSVFEGLSASPVRKYLYNRVATYLEDYLKSFEGWVKRGYIIGSYAGKKAQPGDIDILIRHSKADFPEQMKKDAIRLFEQYGENLPLHVIETPSIADERSKDLLKEGRRRYGRTYKWKRIY